LIEQFYATLAPIALPVFEGRRGHPVIFSAAVYEELQNAPVQFGARSVVWAHRDKISEYVTGEEGCVLNLNDPGTFERVSRAL
jgi:molybdenum cofactor cytidylyltransferase